mgnify:CR=1 FL=1
MRGFNPRTPAGCDNESILAAGRPRRFNPRTPAGCDWILRRFGFTTSVSIHAPLRGATHAKVTRESYRQFQSTHPCGVRRGGLLYWMTGPSFQSTHPCGVRLEQLESLRSLAEFQSTHPCGVRRSYKSWGLGDGHVSIHAPLRGATELIQTLVDFGFCFNPRTPAGCDVGGFFIG